MIRAALFLFLTHCLVAPAAAEPLPREAIEAAALAEPNVAAFVAGQAPKKVIVVPGKIVNIVV